jgi:hypothetical protein
MSAVKRALRETMDLLDEEAESGNVKEGAQVRLAKSLKGAFEASERGEDDVIVEYLIDQLIDYPETICKTTERLANTVRCPRFLCRLVTAKQKSIAGGERIGSEWWGRLMRGVIIDPDDVEDHDARDTRSDISDALDMVNHGQDALAFVENRVDELMHLDDREYVKKLFPLGPPGSEADMVRPTISEPEWPSVWNLLTIDPRFSVYLRSWGNWTKEEHARLKRFHDRFLPSTNTED